MKVMQDGVLVEFDELTDAERDAILAELWVDPMEIEEPTLNTESGFNNEFLQDCN